MAEQGSEPKARQPRGKEQAPGAQSRKTPGGTASRARDNEAGSTNASLLSLVDQLTTLLERSDLAEPPLWPPFRSPSRPPWPASRRA